MSAQDDDKNLFRELFGDIERVTHDRSEQPAEKKPGPRPRPVDVDPQENPYKLSPYPDTGYLSGLDTADLEAAETSYRGNGVQNSVMQKLKRGKIPPESVLDLHGMTREQALGSLQDFIRHSRRQKHRCALIVHGKGYRSQAGKPVLKPAVAHWLRQIDDVLAYCPALARDGGDGAVYVLLRSG